MQTDVREALALLYGVPVPSSDEAVLNSRAAEFLVMAYGPPLAPVPAVELDCRANGLGARCSRAKGGGSIASMFTSLPMHRKRDLTELRELWAWLMSRVNDPDRTEDPDALVGTWGAAPDAFPCAYLAVVRQRHLKPRASTNGTTSRMDWMTSYFSFHGEPHLGVLWLMQEFDLNALPSDARVFNLDSWNRGTASWLDLLVKFHASYGPRNSPKARTAMRFLVREYGANILNDDATAPLWAACANYDAQATDTLLEGVAWLDQLASPRRASVASDWAIRLLSSGSFNLASVLLAEPRSFVALTCPLHVYYACATCTCLKHRAFAVLPLALQCAGDAVCILSINLLDAAGWNAGDALAFQYLERYKRANRRAANYDSHMQRFVLSCATALRGDLLRVALRVCAEHGWNWKYLARSLRGSAKSFFRSVAEPPQS